MNENGQPPRTSEIYVKVKAILMNPDDVWEDEIGVQFSPNVSRQMITGQLLGTIARGGGLTRELDKGGFETEYIPLCRVKSIVVSFPQIQLAHLSPVVSFRQ